MLPSNARLTDQELAFLVDDGEATVIVTDTAHADVARRAAGDARVVVAGEELDGLLDREPQSLDVAEVHADDPAWIFYTSGTTGPRGGDVVARGTGLRHGLLACRPHAARRVRRDTACLPAQSRGRLPRPRRRRSRRTPSDLRLGQLRPGRLLRRRPQPRRHQHLAGADADRDADGCGRAGWSQWVRPAVAAVRRLRRRADHPRRHDARSPASDRSSCNCSARASRR